MNTQKPYAFVRRYIVIPLSLIGALPHASIASQRQHFQIEQTFPAATGKDEMKDVKRRRIHISEVVRFKIQSNPYECSNPDGSKRIVDPAMKYQLNASEWWAEPYDFDLVNDRGEKTKSIISTDWTAEIRVDDSRDDVKIRSNILELESNVAFPTRAETYDPQNDYAGMLTVYWERFVNYRGDQDAVDWRRIGFFKVGLILRGSQAFQAENGDDLGTETILWETDIEAGKGRALLVGKTRPVEIIRAFVPETEKKVVGETLAPEGREYIVGCSWEPIAAWSDDQE